MTDNVLKEFGTITLQIESHDFENERGLIIIVKKLLQ